MGVIQMLLVPWVLFELLVVLNVSKHNLAELNHGGQDAAYVMHRVIRFPFFGLDILPNSSLVPDRDSGLKGNRK